MGSMPFTPPPPLDPSYVPEASIAELPASAPIELILSIIHRDGGVILTDLVSQAELDAIQRETEAWTVKEKKENYDIKIIPKETVLVHGLVAKSKTVADLCEHPILTQLRERMLRETYTVRREGIFEEHTIEPLLSLSVSFRIGTGAPRQHLHRDDIIHNTDHSSRPFRLDEVGQFACLIAGCETTRENGATLFVPGSHRWDDDRVPQLDEVCFAEMKPGSALIFLGSSYHAGGHNAVQGYWRVVHGLFFIRGTMRQEENQFLAVPRTKVLQMSEEMLTLLGYRKPTTTLGVVEGRDPMSDLRSVLANANA